MTQERYAQAYQQGFSRTVRVLRSRGASEDSAKDVAQAAWIRGWQQLHQLRDEGTVGCWVNAIAVNYDRRRSRYEARYQALPELWSDFEVDLAPLDAAKVLKLCNSRDRVLFEEQLGGSTTQEIASRLGVSVATVRVRFSRARRAVRERMARGRRTA